MPRLPRSNPHTRTRAIELRKELTPAEGKLWSRIRNDQLEVDFRDNMLLENTSLILCASKRNSSLSWMGVTTLSRKSTTKREQIIWNRKGTR